MWIFFIIFYIGIGLFLMGTTQALVKWLFGRTCSQRGVNYITWIATLLWPLVTLLVALTLIVLWLISILHGRKK